MVNCSTNVRKASFRNEINLEVLRILSTQKKMLVWRISFFKEESVAIVDNTLAFFLLSFSFS